MPKKRTSEELIAGHPRKAILQFLCGCAVREGDHDPERHFGRLEFDVRFSGRAAAVEQALLDRGWIEDVTPKSKQAKKRFRLSEAGRRLAAESAPLFKWPVARSRIAPPRSRRSSSRECLFHLHAEFARLGISEDALPTYQREMLNDLEAGLDEEALAMMLDWWNYDVDALAARQRMSNYRQGPAWPRIEVTVLLTSKRNLVVEWEPLGLVLGRPAEGCDWRWWMRDQTRHTDFSSRPSNELVFVHGVVDARRHFPGIYDERYIEPDQVMIDAILLCATAGLIGELKARLVRHFDVRMRSDVFITEEEVPQSDLWPHEPIPFNEHVLSTWVIENVGARKRRLELAEIDAFPKEFGCPLEVFVEALKSADVKRPTGPAPSRSTKDERVTRALKKAGYSKITVGTAAHYRGLLERHRPELFPSPPAASAPEAMSAAILPFKRPTDGDPPLGEAS